MVLYQASIQKTFHLFLTLIQFKYLLHKLPTYLKFSLFFCHNISILCFLSDLWPFTRLASLANSHHHLAREVDALLVWPREFTCPTYANYTCGRLHQPTPVVRSIKGYGKATLLLRLLGNGEPPLELRPRRPLRDHVDALFSPSIKCGAILESGRTRGWYTNKGVGRLLAIYSGKFSVFPL